MKLLLLRLHRITREGEVVLAANQAANASGLTRVVNTQARAIALAPHEPLRTRRLQLAPGAEQRAIRTKEELRIV